MFGCAALSRWANPSSAIRRCVFHVEDAEVTINGVLAAKVGGFTGDYRDVAVSPASVAALESGANLIAVRSHQTGGGQFNDVGSVNAKP